MTFATMEDGLSVQMMHIGPYDDEPQSFEQMKKFIFSFGVAVITALFFILLGGVEEKFP